MAGNLYVREFEDVAVSVKGASIEAGCEPPLADQVIAFDGTSASITLNDRTMFVELHADNVCHYVFGATATTSGMRLPGDATVFKGVRPYSRTLSAIEGA